ncbi:MAG TPA: UPF0182 family protein, partial [Candidatus Acidoferrales bacterium]|nr:UPF0182 family protein [Candidatus Acidoferrales bacterium]
MRRTITLILFAALAVAAMVVAAMLSGFLVDWLWFGSLGFGTVFSTLWRTKLLAFGVAASASWVVLAASGLLAVRTPAPHVRRLRIVRGNGGAEGLPEVVELALDRIPWRVLVIALAGLLSVFIALSQVGNWEIFLKWWYAVPFGRTDPAFGHDLGLYVFALPAYGVARDWSFLILFLAAAIAGAVYWSRGAIEVDQGFPRLSAAAVRHFSVLLALFFVVKAGDYILQRYDLLLSNTGVVFGAAYTDVHLRLPLLTGLVGLSLLAAALCAANIVSRGSRLPVAAVVLLIGGSLLDGIIPSLFQSYRVKPDELRLESPYIASNIALTRYGFGLDRVTA